MKTLYAIIVGGVGGVILTATIYSQFVSTEMDMTQSASTEPDPLYWVAPMDPNFRRDEPGKSPMGMDLVPVFADVNKGNDLGVENLDL